MRLQSSKLRASAALLAFLGAMAASPSSFGASEVTIVQNSKPSGTLLVLSRSKNQVVEFAASELSSYIRRISGAALPVVSMPMSVPTNRLSSALVILTGPNVQSELADPDFHKSLIRRLDTSVSALSVPSGSHPPASRDGFVIGTLDGAIYLAGQNDRGTLYAAYRFLESLGVRFYAPEFCFYEGNAEKVPKKSTITVSPMNISETPSYEYRALDMGECTSCTISTVAAEVDWMAKNGMNYLAFPIDAPSGFNGWDQFRDQLAPEIQKRGIILEVGADGVYNTLLPQSEYQAAHPDWFPGPTDPVEGCSCGPACGLKPPANVFHITNPDALNTMIANGKQYLANRPEISRFSIWTPDGPKWAASDIAQIGSILDAPAYVINPFKAALNGSIPVSGLSYSCYTAPPSAPNMYDSATTIKFAYYNRSYRVPIFDTSDPINVSYDGLIPEWRKAGFNGPAFIFEYYTKYSWHSLPFSPVQLIGQEVPYYSTVATGMSHYDEPAKWATYELIHLELAQLMWNTSTDLNSWLQSYLSDRFGPAAGDMALYFNDVEAAGRDLFNNAGGDYGNLTSVSNARTSFLSAKNDLAAAQASTTDAEPLFLIGLLMENIDFAIADTNYSYYTLLGDGTDAAAAKTLSQQLLDSYRFSGIVMEDYYALSRYDKTITYDGIAPWVHQQYESGFAQSCLVPAAAALQSPTPSTVLAGSNVTFHWSAGTAAASYNLSLGTTVGGNDIRGTGNITGTSVTFSPLPTNGETIYARLCTNFASSSSCTDYVYTAATQMAAAVTSPAPNSTLPSSNVTFTWSAGTGAVSYTLRLGTTVGGYDIRGTTTTSTSVNYAPLPTNGETIYVRLYTNYASGRAYTDYVVTAHTILVK